MGLLYIVSLDQASRNKGLTTNYEGMHSNAFHRVIRRQSYEQTQPSPCKHMHGLEMHRRSNILCCVFKLSEILGQ